MYRRAEEEMMVRRRAARALRVVKRFLLVTGWLAVFGAPILFLAGKFDEGMFTTVILGTVEDIILAILLEEFAGLIERREWP